MDLFATRHNHKLPLFVSPVPDPLAWEVEALHLNWTGLLGYAYPPTALLSKILAKVYDQQCHLILIAPGWPGMPWFWDLVKLSLQVPLRLPPIPKLLKQPTRPVFHDNPEHLNLHAWNLGHKPYKGRASLKRWQIELLNLKDLPHERSTTISGPFLFDGVKIIRWTSPECL